MGISPMPELFPKLIEGDVREAASFGLVNPSLVRMFGKPLARELFDYPRCFSAMKIEGALEIAMVSRRFHIAALSPYPSAGGRLA